MLSPERGRGPGGWQVDLFTHRELYEGLINNFPSKEGEMKEVCFIIPYHAGKV